MEMMTINEWADRYSKEFRLSWQEPKTPYQEAKELVEKINHSYRGLGERHYLAIKNDYILPFLFTRSAVGKTEALMRYLSSCIESFDKPKTVQMCDGSFRHTWKVKEVKD